MILRHPMFSVLQDTFMLNQIRIIRLNLHKRSTMPTDHSTMPILGINSLTKLEPFHALSTPLCPSFFLIRLYLNKLNQLDVTLWKFFIAQHVSNAIYIHPRELVSVCGCTALFRCVLVYWCGSAGVGWYPNAGWSTAGLCVRTNQRRGLCRHYSSWQSVQKRKTANQRRRIFASWQAICLKIHWLCWKLHPFNFRNDCIVPQILLVCVVRWEE